MASAFSAVGCKPASEILNPKYSTDGSMKKHLSHLSLTPASSNRIRTASKLCKCSSAVRPDTRISSMYTHTFDMPCRMLSMIR